MTAAAGAPERGRLLDRLSHLRSIIPAFAEEMASARREAARLRVENCKPIDEVQQLRRERSQPAARGAHTCDGGDR
jgi:hypothetical protein